MSAKTALFRAASTWGVCPSRTWLTSSDSSLCYHLAMNKRQRETLAGSSCHLSGDNGPVVLRLRN